MKFCPRCHTELTPFEVDGETLDACGGCHGLFFEDGQLERILGRRVDILPFPTEPPVACPGCEAALDSVSVGSVEWLACGVCGGAWLEAAALPALKRGVVRSTAPPAAPAPTPSPSTRPAPTAPKPLSSAPLEPIADRIGFGHPLVRLLAFPVVGLLGVVLAVFRLAEAPVYFMRLWVHELGHAVPAWLSGRAALPLPIGFTFWREESSWFTAACLFFLIAVFGVASLREKKVFGIALAAVLLVLQAICTLVVSDQAMLGWIVAGGLAGELLISTALIVAFYYPLPDRLRWDFWRFFVLVPAACAFAAAFVMWMRIDRGTQSLPFGSILGAPGDGSGDVERLIDDYDWTESGMTAFYRTLATTCLGVIGVHYALFGIRAFLTRKARPPESASPPE
ncbi:MAG: zf-TFIIB domain-containing protein [Sandaracinaceae bacterium]